MSILLIGRQSMLLVKIVIILWRSLGSLCNGRFLSSCSLYSCSDHIGHTDVHKRNSNFEKLIRFFLRFLFNRFIRIKRKITHIEHKPTRCIYKYLNKFVCLGFSRLPVKQSTEANRKTTCAWFGSFLMLICYLS